jgi:hypothetical protein
MNVVDHGWGVVQFVDVVTFDDAFFDEWFSRIQSLCPPDYEQVDENTFINKGGYTFTREQIMEAPQRVLFFNNFAMNEGDQAFLKYLIESMNKCLKSYFDIYSFAKSSLWWRSLPHLARYLPGGNMGFHHDNLLGETDESEISIFNVVTGGIILKDECRGGELSFKYINKSFPPVKGTCFLYPSGYLGTHAVTPVTEGERIVYLEFFGHGKNKGFAPLPEFD